jgi:hypothetical protein
MKLWLKIAVLLGLVAGTNLSLRAQLPVPPPAPVYQPLSDAQLDQLLGPIALYPDPLIAQILPAATVPTQIVLANRYVSGGGDPNAIDLQPWDPSVLALARYPNVLAWMDQNLDWTEQVGQAFLYQQPAVMESIQRLRQTAYNYGNLQNTPQQQVVNDGGDFEIVPTDPEVIYVPVYQPDVVYYQAWNGSPCISFGIGFRVGLWLDCDFDWQNHNLIVWDRHHPRPANWWHEPSRQRDLGHTTVWHPENRRGAVAGHQGDRGWGGPQSVVTTPNRAAYNNNNGAGQHRNPTPVTRPEAGGNRYTPTVAQPARTPVEHNVPISRPEAPVTHAPIVIPPVRTPSAHAPAISRPEANGAFIGIPSPSETRTFSNRGQQSLETAPHYSAPAPAPAPAPVSRPEPAGGGGGGGGGGGSHGSGQNKQH